MFGRCFITIILLAMPVRFANGDQPAGTQPQNSPPNILFLFADDFTYEAIQAFGRTDIETPNLDSLARQGTTFTHAYNMGSWSGAVCVASRTMLITGRDLWRANAVYKTTDKERQAGRLWPQLMKEAGYQTFMTGKWHIQTDAAKVFDAARHIRPGMPKTVPTAYNRPLAGQPDTWSPFDKSLGGFWEGGKHWSEVTADDAIDFLSMANDQPNPFFMYVAFNAPHDPRQAPEEFVKKYPAKRVKVPDNFKAQYPYDDSIGTGPKLRDEALAPFPRTPESIQTHRGEYYALITHLDQQIGRVLKALEKSGKGNNTWIFFTADHGLAVGHHGLLGKQNMYDHSVRVPFIVKGLGVPANEKRSAEIYLQDVMPTTLELANVAPPDYVNFHSLLPLITDPAHKSYYPAIYGAYLHLQRSVTCDGWKLIAYPNVPTVRLYHVAEDPQEQNDLAGNSQYQAKASELLEKLVDLQGQLDDSLDLSPLVKTATK